MPITANQPQPKQPKKKGSNIGPILFVVFILWRIFGSNLNGWFRRLRLPSGAQIGTSNLLLLVGAGVAVLVVVFIIRQAVNRRGSSDQMLPTGMPLSTAQSQANRMPSAAQPPFASSTPRQATPPKMPQMTNRQQANAFNPKAPSYEPALRGNVVLAAMVFGGLLFGGLYLLNLL